MNLKALTVALVLGSSSMALASPDHRFEVNANLRVNGYGRWSSEPKIRDHRTPQRPEREFSKLPTYQLERWNAPRSVMLSSDIAFAGATTRTIYVGARAGSFTTLELAAVAGSPEIQQLWIQYDDGSEQAFHNLNATLVRRPLVLKLNTVARAIEKIVVYAPGYGTAKRTSSDLRDAAGMFSLSAR